MPQTHWSHSPATNMGPSDSDASSSVSLRAAMTTMPLSSNTYLARLPSDHCLGSGENVPPLKLNRLMDNLSQRCMAGFWHLSSSAPCGSILAPPLKAIISPIPSLFTWCSCALPLQARPLWRSKARNQALASQQLMSV